MVVLGGLGNIWGSVIGAAALTAIPEFLRASADYRQLFYGAILVLMMRVRPEGIISGKKSRKIPPGKISARQGKNKFLKATK